MPTEPAVNTAAPKSFLATLKANLTAALADKVDLQSKLDAALAKHGTDAAEITRLTTENTELHQCNQELDASAAALLIEKDAALAEVARIKKRGSASAGAQEIVATVIGVDVGALPAQQAAGAAPKDAHAQEYQRLLAEDSTKAGEYYAKHREKITT